MSFSLAGIFLLVGSGLLVLLAFGVCQIFLPGFIDLERKEMVRNLQQVREQIGNDLAQIGTTAADYSGWDEAYQFVGSGDREFIKTNLHDAIFSELHLDLLIYLDSSGTIRFCKLFNVAGTAEIPPPAALLGRLHGDWSMAKKGAAEKKKEGILVTPEGLLLLATHPVLKSDFSGPPAGILAVGRYLDAGGRRRLADTLHLSLEILPLAPEASAPDSASVAALLAPAAPAHLIVPQGKKVHGYMLFRDLGGAPAFIVKVTSPRDIYLGGQQMIHYFLVLALLVTIVTGAVILLLIRRRQELEDRYRSLVHSSAEGIVLLEPADFTIIEANEAFAHFVGDQIAEIPGKSLLHWIPKEHSAAREVLLRAFSDRKEVPLRHADGHPRIAELIANRISYRGTEAVALIVHDMTDRRHLEEQLVYQANHDTLTGLPNRNLLADRLQQGLAIAARQQQCLSIALIDLDNFKMVNDNCGHAVGDRLLVTVTQRLRSCCRASDTLARLGGDEFIVLSVCARPENAIRLAENIHRTLTAPFLIDQREFHVTATVGIAQFPEDGSDGEDLLRKADVAMYHAKSTGKNGFAFFREEMNLILEERTAILAQLRHAIERGELELYYQPKISCRENTVCGLEALLRWQNSELGHVPPARFIPVAEEAGLILPIGEWVLQSVADHLLRWQEEGVPVSPVAINISARQFAHSGLVESIEKVLRQTGLDPGLLQLELTETMIMQNIDESIQRMFQVKELGIGIAVDDFGTGYSSLSYISQFPIECLKIDRSFVAGIEDDPIKRSIVRTIIVLAHGLGLKVVAEGVETIGQMEFVRSLHCEELQGYLFSAPLPVGEVGKFLREWAPPTPGKEAGRLAV